MQPTTPPRPSTLGWSPEKKTATETPAPAAKPVAAVKDQSLTQSLPYLTENDHVLIMSKAKPVTFRKGESLIRQSLPSKALYIVRSGSARVERNGVRLATIGVGNVCGEMTLLEESPSSASVIAEEPVVVDAVEVGDMRQVFDSFPHLASRFYRSIALNLSKKLRATSTQLTQAIEKGFVPEK
jgi:CRP-like cAMP-binding protein